MKPMTKSSLERLLKIACLLGLAGLATALIYVFYSTPYTMVLFMACGITMIGISIALLGWALVSDIRSRLGTMRSRSYAVGDEICRQGEIADYMFVITEGEVEFVAEEEGRPAIVLGKLGPSDYFGDMAILSEQPFQATARALTEVQLLTIHKQDFQSMYAHLPDLKEKVHREGMRKRAMAEQALSESSA